MASSEDYKKLYELYQVEGVPKGISIVDFCQRNGIVYKHFERWFKKRYSQNKIGFVSNMMVGEMIYPIRKGRKPRFCKETLWSSLQSRLIAAGVGRINMRNYENNSNHHSWMSAFSLLDKNPWSVKQLKMLDRHRYCVLSRAYRVLNSLLIEWPRITKADTHGMKEGDRYAYKGNPFSYYGQCFDYRV